MGEVRFLRGTSSKEYVDAVTDPDAHAKELMARTARGDEAAFEGIYDAFASNVFGMVLRVLRDRAQSEEVAQEIMLEVWRSAARYSPTRGSVRSWILTMAHHRAVDRVRSSQSASRREERVGQQQDRPFDEVIEEVEHRLEVESVRHALHALTDLQKEAVSLAYYQGMTHREVASALDVPLGTVKTRLRDGLIRLRDEMGVAS